MAEHKFDTTGKLKSYSCEKVKSLFGGKAHYKIKGTTSDGQDFGTTFDSTMSSESYTLAKCLNKNDIDW